MGNGLGNILVVPYGDEKKPHLKWKVEVPRSIDPKRPRKFFQTKSAALDWKEHLLRLYRDHGEKGLDLADGNLVGPLLDVFEARKQAKSKHHSAKLRYWIKKMRAAWAKHPASVLDSIEHIERFIHRSEWSQSTRASAWRYVRMALLWLRNRGYITTSVPEKLDSISAGDGPKEILTPDEMVHLLDLTASDQHMRAYLAIGAFSGLRPEEIQKLGWDAVDFSGGYIHVGEEIIKQSPGALARSVRIESALLRTIPPDIPKSGKVFPLSASTLARRRLVLVGKMARKFGSSRWRKWPHDCLRHSFGTYTQAAKQDIGYVAFQLGHRSTYMTNKHYVRWIKPDVSAAWMAIAERGRVIAA